MIINRIQVLNYGCLRYVDVPMDRFHVLIGPNASGKSTLMDAIKFVSDVVRDGVSAACERRTANFADLVWGRPEDPEEQRFEIALEFELPIEALELLPSQRNYRTFRYELSVGIDVRTSRVSLLKERGVLRVQTEQNLKQSLMFPEPDVPPQTLTGARPKGQRTIFSKSETGRSRFNDETIRETGSVNWNLGLNLSSDRSALSIMPDHDEKYPASTRAMVFLRDKVTVLALNSERMRQASRPGVGIDMLPDGSNLPWVADAMISRTPDLAGEWIGHIQCALSGLHSVKIMDRPDDRHKYLMLQYSHGLDVPSWKVSDGTLRLMALTMLAYSPQSSGLYMIEEPENGIHPGALQDVFDSLSSVYEAQVLLASHSPEFVAIANVHQLLCFGKTDAGVVDIVRGNSHPRLKDWQYETDLGTFFASGILA
ncbi:MAG: AAA family ATPase [Chloroflexota bacterium]|nr:AAA family ATPase [Chloroflexota bacterium]MDE2961114.1 AAA family ATPase [Chloroflexota bacterium]